MQKCENCRGTGFIPLYSVWLFLFYLTNIKCGVCLGKGELSDNERLFIGGKEVVCAKKS